MSLSSFHPAVAAWFESRFGGPTTSQAKAWPAIQDGRHVLIAAPTGSGKTLAAFLAAIDELVRQGLNGTLTDETQIVYVSPLKALSNDIQRNLEAPLAGIRQQLRERGLPDVEIRTAVRTGDTSSGERERMRRLPPHIIVTTPESLYVLLGSESGRGMLKTTRAVIVDEIHAVASNKRGAHLLLSLERLASLCRRPLQRIGLSATQKPIETVACLLTGAGAGIGAESQCTIIDAGHRRARDLALEVPSSPLEAVMSAEVWSQIYDRLAELIQCHRTTLIFVNTRRMAERLTRQVFDRLGKDQVAAHHGSLSKEQRLDSERRLQQGKLKALVATASLELGIDIGEVDLVCQIGSPRSIASFLQRVGRSGHAVDGTPKGRLFPLSRDDLVECAALIDSVNRGDLDRLTVPEQPLDVLAQQIVAEVSAREWKADELFHLLRRAWPYRSLSYGDFSSVVTMLSDGITSRRGRRGALIHHDAVNGLVRGRRGSRLTALTSGGTIPDNADYQVLLEPESQVIGTVHEDFAVESMAGDVFQLGNTSYRIIRVERGIVRVNDAEGATPTIPFWLGEAPARSDELSDAVSRLRSAAARLLAADPTGGELCAWLVNELEVVQAAAEQIAEYLSAGHAALGCLPTRDRLVFERFFDEAGGMQLVIHSPYGNRINRAWGLALRKRFCRKFNFELQAAASEDNIVLSLTTAHSFELADVASYLHSVSVKDVLIQALLDAPMFITRWRWVIGVALALPRFRGGKKVAPQLARMGAEDLIASVFPDQIACAENLVGEREVPDHPLVNQTIADCLHEAMDIRGLERLLTAIETGAIDVTARDLTQPSPLALEVLAARPYAYLDDAPLEERRTQAVMNRRWLDAESAADIGRLDAEAIERVREESWPEPANADEVHDALVWLGCLSEHEVVPEWRGWLARLQNERRAAQSVAAPEGLWIAAEHLQHFQAVWPSAVLEPHIEAPAAHSASWSREEALVELIRGRLEGEGPTTAASLAATLRLDRAEIASALAALETEGFVMRGRFTPGAPEEEWCERRLLARIHRYTVKRLRAEIEPVAARDFMRFLFEWQRVSPDSRMEGSAALYEIVGQLEGFEAPAGAWETEILPLRLANYDPEWLDDQCLAGRIGWAQLRPRIGRTNGKDRRPAPVRSTPIALLPRRHANIWVSCEAHSETVVLSAGAREVADYLGEHGASFFDELVDGTRLLAAKVEDALGELVGLGLVTSDSFGGLRALLLPSSLRKAALGGGGRRRRTAFGMENAGRWTLARRVRVPDKIVPAEHIARTLLRRYGVVFWRLLDREADRLPPWRELLRVYRRLEARGEIRGGRFVAGFSGEHFALPEAVTLLREVRRKKDSNSWISLSGADPLNLAGILTPGPKLPALTGNRLLFRDGLPAAWYEAGEVRFLQELDAATQGEARGALLRSAVPRSLVRLS
jgi:ATP-dependent Lhr-like helicase